MKWKFWESEPSLKQLDPHMLAFIMVQGFPGQKFPFNKWRGEGDPIPEFADAFVEIGVNIYQLSILLDFLERKFGKDLSEIVKAHLISLMSRGEHATAIRNYFEAIQTGRTMPEREEYFAGKPQIQTDCNVAKAFLSVVSESAEVKTKLYPLLGQSLTLGRISAEAAFGGLVEQIEFRPETVMGLCKPEKSSIVWSETCGAFERQLQRRHNNPFFPPEKRRVITAEVLWARSQDLYDLLQLQADIERCLKGIVGDAKEKATFGEVLKTREVVESLIIQAAGIGNLANNQRQKVRALYDSIVESLRDACPAESRANLDAALANSESLMATFANSFVAQMNRKNSPIPAEDLLRSLLLEDLDTVRTVVSTLSTEALRGIGETAAAIIEDARKAGYMVPQAEEKLRAFNRAPNRT